MVFLAMTVYGIIAREGLFIFCGLLFLALMLFDIICRSPSDKD